MGVMWLLCGCNLSVVLVSFGGRVGVVRCHLGVMWVSFGCCVVV